MTVEKRVEPPVRERVVDLPEDGGSWHFSFIYRTKNYADPLDRKLAGTFKTNQRLQYVINQTMVHEYQPGHRMFEARYRDYYGDNLPAVMLQRDDGTVCWKVSGESLAALLARGGDVTAESLEAAIFDCRPRPEPAPAPGPNPVDPISPPMIPDIKPPASPSGLPWYVWLLPLAAGLGGVYSEARKRFAP